MLLIGVVILSYKSLSLIGCGQLKAINAIVVFILGSGLFHYATYDCSFSHIYSAFGFSLMLYLSISNDDRKYWSNSNILILALIIFWMMLIRQTNVLLIVSLVWLELRKKEFRTNIKYYLITIFAIFSAVFVQTTYNFYVTGEFHFSSYGQENFNKIGSHSVDVLFSYERGLFVYYPVFLIVVLIAFFTWRQAMSQSFIVLIIAYTLIYGSWHSWYLGGGMGHRGFVEMAPLGILILGSFLKNAKKRTLVILNAFLIMCMYITTVIMISYWNSEYPFSGANKHMYISTISSGKL
jgi:hypothetical protein